MNTTTAPAVWSTRQFKPQAQFDAWRDTVSRTHLAWDLPGRHDGAFAGQIEQQGLGAATVVACVCDPCYGARRAPQLASADGEYFGVLHVVAGVERISQAGREAPLQAGDLCVWDSRRPIQFEVGSRLGKLTLLLPQPLLRAALPDVDDRVARPLGARGGSGALFASHLRMLARERSRVPEMHAPGLLASTLALLVLALSPEAARAADAVAPRPSERLARAQACIALQLRDPALSPARIAAEQAISTRALYRVFEQAGLSVERCIWSARIEMCRQQLLRQPGATISAVAFDCGFSDAAHFSRAFRAHCGLSAREYRRRARGPD